MTGEICVRARPRQGPLRPAVGHRAGQRRATAGWHRTGDVGHLDDDGPAVGRGPAGPRGHHRRRAGHPGRDRAAGRGRSTASRPPPSSGSGRPAPSRSWSSSSTGRRRVAAGAARRPALADAGLAAPSAPPPGCPWPRCWSPTALPVDIRHDSKIDRAPGGPLGRPGAGRRAGRTRREGPGHRRERHARRRRRAGPAPRAATTSPCCSAAPPGCGLREVLGDVADPAAVARRRARAGRRRAPGRQGRRDRARGPTSRAPTSTAPRRSSPPCRAGGVRPARARLVAVGRARRVAPWSGRGAGPADPRRARGHYARSKAVAERLALRADGPRPGRRRGPPAPGVGARRHPARRPASSQRARAGRLAGRRLRRRADRHAPTSTTPSTRSSPPLDRCARAARRGPRGLQRRAAPGRRAARRHLRGRRASPPPRRRVPSPSPGPPAPPSTPCGAGSRCRRAAPDDPPMTRFLAEQLATAHWFDQRRDPRGARLGAAGQPGRGPGRPVTGLTGDAVPASCSSAATPCKLSAPDPRRPGRPAGRVPDSARG